MNTWIVFLYAQSVILLVRVYTGLLDHQYITSLNDDKIVNLFLHGDPDFSFEVNSNIIAMAQSFIVDSKMCNLRDLR